MEPLFEAKATYKEELATFNIFRLEEEKYKAELVQNEDKPYTTDVPKELVVEKLSGQWQTDRVDFKELGSTLGVEIDVFNSGYGDLLGRIGVR